MEGFKSRNTIWLLFFVIGFALLCFARNVPSTGNTETYYKLVINDYEPPGPNRPMPPYETHAEDNKEYNYNNGQRTNLQHETTLPSRNNTKYIKDYEEPHPNRPTAANLHA
ncbi:uncharacterized protein LOC133034001 [Cannabis sativa]|uniref:uncharacterized protein LOC133034001 n=1 Tax=Cannabis sativa TaxID=3483 RepID=UPI0029CA2365|nr:uncharacterized protein LOC133034001 [Cannabis sativa]